MTINEINYTDQNLYPKASANNINKSNNSFDSVFRAETCIYATPASHGLQSDISNNASSCSSISSPENLDRIFKEAASTYEVSENLLKAVAKAESGFNANAISSAGAIGIMQLMPSTAASLGVTNPYDAAQNIMGGAKLLSQLLKKYNNNTSLALAAYNAGSGNVDKYGGIPPFTETQNYVSKVLSYLDGYNTSSDAVTIYATAANDATKSSQIYSFFAQPATNAEA